MFSNLTPEMQKLYDVITEMLEAKKPFHIFLHGAGGTGKTWFIQRLVESLSSNRYLLVAPTNITAKQCRGETIHKAFKYPLNMWTADDIWYDEKPNLELVIIDEALSLKGSMLIEIDQSLRKMTGRREMIYGGCSMILAGDLKQATVGGDLIYNVPQWELFQRVDFTDMIRQAGDADLAERLQRWADGTVTPSDHAYLQNKQVCPHGLDYAEVARSFLNFPPGKNFIVCQTQSQVDRFNDAVTRAHSGPDAVSYVVPKVMVTTRRPGVYGPDQYEEDPKKGAFILTKGACIIFTGRMQSLGSFVAKNGDVGTVEEIRTCDGKVLRIHIKVDHSVHSFARTATTEWVDKCAVITKSFHIDNAYAIHVRKTHGMTLDKIIVDTSAGMDSALGYTSFSRVRSGRDLHVTHLPPNLKKVISADPLIPRILERQAMFNVNESQIVADVPKAVEVVKEEELDVPALTHSITDPDLAERLQRWADDSGNEQMAPSDHAYLKDKQICPLGLDHEAVARVFLKFPAGKNFIVCQTQDAVNRFNEAAMRAHLGPDIVTHVVPKVMVLKRRLGSNQPAAEYVEDKTKGTFIVAKGAPVMLLSRMVSIENHVVQSGVAGKVTDFRIVNDQVHMIKIKIANRKHTFMRTDTSECGEEFWNVYKSFPMDNRCAILGRNAQGMTMDKVIVDTSVGLDPAFAYNAFSRVRKGQDIRVTHLHIEI